MSAISENTYNLLAPLVAYPEEEYKKRIREAYDHLAIYHPTAAGELKTFMDEIQEKSLEDIRELFLNSFEIQAITTLDIGYIIFGEDYKRGQLLVNLTEEHEAVNNPCHNELADHLPNVLRLLPKMDDRETANDLVDHIVFPALIKMINEFSSEKIEKKKEIYKKHQKTLIKEEEHFWNIYYKALMAIGYVLQEDYHIQEAKLPDVSNDFLKNVDNEIKIKANSNP